MLYAVGFLHTCVQVCKLVRALHDKKKNIVDNTSGSAKDIW